MEKKGTHVGFVISMIIFISFVVFVFIVFEPFVRHDREKPISLNHLRNGIIEESSSDVVTLNLKSPVTSGCFAIRDLGNLLSFPDGRAIDFCNLTIKDGSGEILNYSSSDCSGAGELKIEVKDSGFLKFYYPENHENLEGSFVSNVNSDCRRMNYNLGQVKSGKRTFFSLMKKLAKEYNASYQDSRERFGVPYRMDFRFYFTDGDGNSLFPLPDFPVPSGSSDVLASRLPVIYVDETADLKSGFLKVEIW